MFGLTPAILFDVLLAAALLWSAVRALWTPDLFQAVVTFIVFGLLVALAWARLGAPDIALAEAAIGAGLTGALLLDAVGSLGARASGRAAGSMAIMRGLLMALLCAGLGLALVWAILQLPSPSVRLPALVAGRIAESGVSHPVTAVLLNFRGYDTLLEIAVLLLALLGVLTGTGAARRVLPAQRPGLPILRAFARLLAPLMVLVAGYLLWSGSHAPGGAFQAGAVLGAAGVLLHLARLLPAWATPGRALRAGLAAGFLVFLGVAAWPLIATGGRLLQYPPAAAGALMLLVEAALAVSIGLLLAGLFLLLSADGVELEP